MRRVALVVGNGAYQAAPALANPKNDAEAVAKVLTSLDFEVDLVVDADRVGLEKAILRFAKLSEADAGLFFYAGHGLQVNGHNYLMPVDAEIESEQDLLFAAIEVAKVLRLIERVSPIKLVVLDACRDNPIARTLAARMGTRSILVGRGLSRMDDAPKGTLIVYSTAPGEVAEDGAGANSSFTAALVKHLPTPGLSVHQVLIQVRRSVMDATRNQQVPWEHSSLTSDFYFVKSLPLKVDPVPKSAPTVESELLFWQTIKDSANPADFQAYLKQFPNGTFADLARIRMGSKRQYTVHSPVLRAVPTQPGQVFWEVPNGPGMVVIPAGRFMMGSSEGEEGGLEEERPRQRVIIARPFALGIYPVTFDQWDACVADGGGNGYSPADEGWGRGRRPVIHVSWNEAQAYLQWLNGKVEPTGKEGPYRLPSEAEWEYAARAGTTTRYWWGDDKGRNMANCIGGGSPWDGKQTAPVGSFRPNQFEVYDMLGNVWEWTQDTWHDTYRGRPLDGSAWVLGGSGDRTGRGGSWNCDANAIRVAIRGGNSPDRRFKDGGFRVARTLFP